MPQIAIFILNGTAVPRAGDKTAGPGTEGGVRRVGERPQGGISHIVPVAVNRFLRGGRGVLEIIFPVPFVHEGALQEGLAGKVKKEPVHETVREGVLPLFLAGIGEPFPAMVGLILTEHGLFLPNGQHGLPVQFDPPDWLHIAAAPVEVHPAVIVPEQVGVPEVKGGADFLEAIRHRIFGAPDSAGRTLVRSTEIKIVPDLPHIRGIAVDVQIPVFMPAPADQIVRAVESGAHADKQVVSVLKIDQGGVRTLPVGCGAVVLVFVVQIQRVAVFPHFQSSFCSIFVEIYRICPNYKGYTRRILSVCLVFYHNSQFLYNFFKTSK